MDKLLLETGDALLKEDGGFFLLEVRTRLLLRLRGVRARLTRTRA